MELGQIVLSKSGRDKDRYFIVVGIGESKEYVLLSDGAMRKVEKPKKKKIKHIVPLHIDDTLNKKFTDGVRVTNPELKKHIRNFVEQNSDAAVTSVDEGGKYHG